MRDQTLTFFSSIFSYDDDRYYSRYDYTRPAVGGAGGYYDRYSDSRYPASNSYGDYRGNGYDSRDRMNYDQQRDGFYRGGSSTYDRGYDRTNDYRVGYPMSSRTYDYKNFRPWDETYRYYYDRYYY